MTTSGSGSTTLATAGLGKFILREVKSEAITTTVIFKGKAYKVTFTPPKSATGHFIYQKDHIEKIKDMALDILDQQGTAQPESLKDHVFKAEINFSESAEKIETATISVHVKKNKDTEFKTLALRIDKLSQKALGVLTKISSSGIPILKKVATIDFPTEPVRKRKVIQEFLGSYYLKDNLDSAKLLAKTELMRERGLSETAHFTPNETDLNNKTQEILNSHFQTEYESIDQSPLVDPDLGLSVKPIYNPSLNCFMNASLVTLLNSGFYLILRPALTSIINSPAIADDYNPTITNLEGRYHVIELDADYKSWDLSDSDKTKAVFINLTTKRAASVALDLINKYRDEPLNEKESEILRLCCLKLFNKKTDDFGSDKKIPHVDAGAGMNILWNHQESSVEFIQQFLHGIESLSSAHLIDLKTVGDAALDPFLTFVKVKEEGGETQIDVNETIKCSRDDELPMYINLACNLDLPNLNFNPILDNFEDKGYDLKSFVVRIAETPSSGHFVSYVIEKVNDRLYFLKIDDYEDPSVTLVTENELNDIIQGKRKKHYLESLMFKKR